MTLKNYYPKISCLMVTSDNRLEFFKKSLNCFYLQTYKNKELVIVTDGSEEYKSEISSLVQDDPDVKLVFLKRLRPLGALRNISLAVSSGDFFLQWDDDDFNMPDRMLLQYDRMRSSDLTVSFLGDQLHYFFPTKTLYWEDWKQYGNIGLDKHRLIPGTIMARKSQFSYKYPSTGRNARVGEDTVFSDSIILKEKYNIIDDLGHLHLYTFHGNNAWNLDHHMIITKHRSKMIDEVISKKNLIISSLDHMDLSSQIEIFGRDGLAFNYNK